MEPSDLLTGAKFLASRSTKRPKQADLRRAQSAAYYALFHALARCCADALVGGPHAGRAGQAWTQAYRALDHAHAKKKCMSNLVGFPPQLQVFARLFVQMQQTRHSADYDPKYRTSRSEVLSQIDDATAVIGSFREVGVKDKRAFAIWILMKTPRAD